MPETIQLHTIRYNSFKAIPTNSSPTSRTRTLASCFHLFPLGLGRLREVSHLLLQLLEARQQVVPPQARDHGFGLVIHVLHLARRS